MKFTAMLALAMALGTSAFAAEIQTTPVAKLLGQQVRVTEKGLRPMNKTLVCNEAGETCYPDDSWLCCSGSCIDFTCR